MIVMIYCACPLLVHDRVMHGIENWKYTHSLSNARAVLINIPDEYIGLLFLPHLQVEPTTEHNVHVRCSSSKMIRISSVLSYCTPNDRRRTTYPAKYQSPHCIAGGGVCHTEGRIQRGHSNHELGSAARAFKQQNLRYRLLMPSTVFTYRLRRWNIRKLFRTQSRRWRRLTARRGRRDVVHKSQSCSYI